jgi:uncharacterized protein YdaU (DUF1376 family)
MSKPSGGSRFFYFPFYVDAWLGSEAVAAMSPEERGAYIQLLCYAWKSADCGLPDDDEVLARLSGLNERWLNGRSTSVKRQFNKDATTGRLYNTLLLNVRAETEKKSQYAAAAGRISGEHRRLKNKAHRTNVQRTFNERSTDVELSKDKYKSKNKKQIQHIGGESWTAFIEMRKKNRGRFTDRAADLIQKKLSALAEEGYPPEAVLDQSILNGWKDVYPLKNYTPTPNSRKPFQDFIDWRESNGDDYQQYLSEKAEYDKANG